LEKPISFIILVKAKGFCTLHFKLAVSVQLPFRYRNRRRRRRRRRRLYGLEIKPPLGTLAKPEVPKIRTEEK